MAEAQSEEYPRLGRYQVINKIAAGGMAEVYLAKAIGAMGFQRLVALKLIHSNFTRDEEFVKMFIDEARIAMHLHHRNIVQVFDLDQVGDTYFIAMEFVHGINLYDLYERIASKNRWIDPPMALYLIAEVSKGLHFAHTRTGPDGKPLGIVHRDISPQNVMLSFEGEVKITDFGIATAAERLHQTAAGIVKGKYAYMAPERLQEQPIDARVDVFAIGVLLYELLVGENPFAGPSAVETIENVLNKRIPAPSERGAPVSKRLDEICLRALAREPSQRYASAQALADAVTEYAMELTHARKEMAAGDSALTSLLAELFPERVASPPRAADPASLDLPGVEVEDVRPNGQGGQGGQGDFMETQEDLPAEVVSAAMEEEDDDEFDAPTVLRMQAPKVETPQPRIAGDNSGMTTLPPDADEDFADSGDRTAPTELPPAYANIDATIKADVVSADDDAYARTLPSSSGLNTLPDDIDEPAVVSVKERASYADPSAQAPIAPPKSDQLVVPVSSVDMPAPPPRPPSRLNTVAGALLALAVLVVGAAMFVVSGKETALIQIDSTPAGAEVWLNGVKHDKTTPFTLPMELDHEMTVQFKKKGYKPYERRIRPASAMTLTAQLEEITGTLFIDRSPPEAEVIVNGVLYEGEEVRLTKLKLGQPIEVVVQADRHIAYEKTLTLTLDSPNQNLGVALAPGRDKRPKHEPKKRGVSLETGSVSVRVYRGKEELCDNTPCFVQMPIGKYRLELKKRGEREGKLISVHVEPDTEKLKLEP